MFLLSFVPFGVGKFYSGDYFNGLFELLEGLIAIASIAVWYFCKTKRLKPFYDILLVFALLSCYVIEVTHMICSKQVEAFYIIIMVISLILTCILRYWSCNNVIVIVTLLTTLFLSASDAFMVWFFKEVDGHGCPLID